MLLSVFMCCIKERHIYEALIMRSWPWIEKKEEKKKKTRYFTGNVTETKKKTKAKKKKTHNVITELRWKDDRSFPVRKRHGNGNHVSEGRKRKSSLFEFTKYGFGDRSRPQRQETTKLG